MSITTDSTRTYSGADPEGRSCQSPVITLQTQDQADAVVALVTGATGSLETVPECPAFPHLPADIQRALADFDARVADGRLPMAADEHPAIPPAAEAWISDFLHSHIPTEIWALAYGAPRGAVGRFADPGAETSHVGTVLTCADPGRDARRAWDLAMGQRAADAAAVAARLAGRVPAGLRPTWLVSDKSQVAGRSRSLAKLGVESRDALAAGSPATTRVWPPSEARLGTIIPRIGQLADGMAPASAHDRQRNQYR